MLTKFKQFSLFIVLGLISPLSLAYTVNVNIHNLSSEVAFDLKSMTTNTANTNLQHASSAVQPSHTTSDFYATATTPDITVPGIIMTFIPSSGSNTDNNSPCTIQIAQNKPYFSCSNSCICNLESANISGSTAKFILTLDYKVTAGSLGSSSTGISTSQ